MHGSVAVQASLQRGENHTAALTGNKVWTVIKHSIVNVEDNTEMSYRVTTRANDWSMLDKVPESGSTRLGILQYICSYCLAQLRLTTAYEVLL